MGASGRHPPSIRAGAADRFADRAQAGDLLADALAARLGEAAAGAVVLGLPRGGVPVAARVAARLHVPLDVVVVRKLGLPSQPEVAVGAVGEGGVIVVNPRIARRVPAERLDELARREEAEVGARVGRWRDGPGLLDRLRGRTVVLVDDGVATGATVRAAVAVVRAHGADRVVLAVPVAAPDALEILSREVDDVVCLLAPPDFRAVGLWYDDFAQVPDDEVRRLLDAASRDGAARDGAAAARPVPGLPVPVDIPSAVGPLPGALTVPDGATGLVIFVHGSGSSRNSPRNVAVARQLNAVGLATLLLDLLTPDEARERAAVFDVALLADRLGAATAWAATEADLAHLPLGYFGASTGAAAALWAAADRPDRLRAVVSRGGRPDLAAERLGLVEVPTLLIVGERDADVLAFNRSALTRLAGPARIEVVAGATHLFEELGTLETAGTLAADWFRSHLR